MKRDIVERMGDGVPDNVGDTAILMQEAIDEIERLRAQVAHAKARLSDLEYFWMGSKEDLWGPLRVSEQREYDKT